MWTLAQASAIRIGGLAAGVALAELRRFQAPHRSRTSPEVQREEGQRENDIAACPMRDSGGISTNGAELRAEGRFSRLRRTCCGNNWRRERYWGPTFSREMAQSRHSLSRRPATRWERSKTFDARGRLPFPREGGPVHKAPVRRSQKRGRRGAKLLIAFGAKRTCSGRPSRQSRSRMTTSASIGLSRQWHAWLLCCQFWLLAL